jgi:hypothetical protein
MRWRVRWLICGHEKGCMAEQVGLPEEEPVILVTDRERHDAPPGRGTDGAGGSSTVEVEKELEDRFEGLNLVGEKETYLDFF